MAEIHEIAPDVFRISVFVPEINLAFNHFLIRDDEPLLFHAGLRGMFPVVREAVEKLTDAARLRHIGFSHFESDECGALNDWLGLAPQAEAVCGLVGAMVSVNDFAARPARVLSPAETFSTGKYRFRFIPTPHVPHGWDAGVLFEETGQTLFCSDLFHQWGERAAITTDNIVDAAREALLQTEASPLAGYIPYTHHTGRILHGLADLQPKTLATMHGSSYAGDGGTALRDLAEVMREVLGPEAAGRQATA
jgi:flavorubredoxin